ASGLSLVFGMLLALSHRGEFGSLSLRQTFVLTTLSWLVMAAFASVPFMLSDWAKMSPTDAFFEAMSGLTTTGSTVIIGLGQAPDGLLLWRALLQWLGGVGIIVLGIAVLPFLRVGGMQLFHSESSDRSDKVLPRSSDLALAIGWIYLSLTAACALSLRMFGMSWFDAVCHAMTALSTGGFSTQDASIAWWQSPAIEWTMTIFMMAAALPFVRYIAFIRGDWRAFVRDSQVRHFVAFLVLIWIGIGLWHSDAHDRIWYDGIRDVAFSVTAIVTTTGYVASDFTKWGVFAVTLFFLLIMIGGCTGSTAGGIKIFRFEIMFIGLRRQMVKLFSPNQILPAKYNGKPVDADIMLSVMNFSFVFLMLMLTTAVALGAYGLDFETALSGAATAVANVGPGLGTIIGPTGNFAALPDGAKWILAFAMLLGRLELFTVLVLLLPRFWHR
ncbi:MAG: TrkH family potassium uptake protein, partial [Pseudomonadota bacterium]|nr:TrkH family potassium uptake protein [Pseudomonadota bacterium]